jgi:hypothetical protein
MGIRVSIWKCSIGKSIYFGLSLNQCWSREGNFEGMTLNHRDGWDCRRNYRMTKGEDFVDRRKDHGKIYNGNTHWDIRK